MKTLSFYIFVFLIGVAVAQFAFYYPVMPDPMVSHFGFSGKGDSEMSKNGFFILLGIIFLIMVISFIGMPRFFRKYKVKNSINLPNKDYWLAPERIDIFYDYFEHSFQWFGAATLILLITAIQLTFEANLQPEPVLNLKVFLTVFFGYLAFVIIWMISFYRKFSKTE